MLPFGVLTNDVRAASVSAVETTAENVVSQACVVGLHTIACVFRTPPMKTACVLLNTTMDEWMPVPPAGDAPGSSIEPIWVHVKVAAASGTLASPASRSNAKNRSGTARFITDPTRVFSVGRRRGGGEGSG